MMVEIKKNTRIIRTLILSVILLVIMVQFTRTLGLFARGFDSQAIFEQFLFYVAPGISLLVIVLAVFFIEILITSKDSKYGNSIAFADQGEFPAIPIFKLITPLGLLLISLTISVILGAVALFTQQQTFTGLAVLPQQFTAVSSTIFSSALIPISENLDTGALLAVLFLVLRIIARRTDMNKGAFATYVYFFGTLLSGITGVLNHLFRYSGSETSLIVVFIFWSVGGFITILTGSFIPFVTLHFANNFFYDLRRFLSTDGALQIFIILITLLVIIDVVYFYYKFRRRGQ